MGQVAEFYHPNTKGMMMNATEMRLIGTICHSDHNPADGVRVSLYERDGSHNVLAAAAGEEAYETDVRVGRERQAWSGACWDFMPAK